VNRREFIGGVAAGAAAMNCPSLGQSLPAEPEGEKVELFGPSLYQVTVKCEWSAVEQAWNIAAICYDPPVISCGRVPLYGSNGQQLFKTNAECRDTLLAVQDACLKTVRGELMSMAKQQAESPLATYLGSRLWDQIEANHAQ
jgi:hypothetical protein